MKVFNLRNGPKEDLSPIMNCLWHDIQDVANAIGAFASGLFHDERGRIALVQESELALGGQDVVGIQKDASVHQGSMKISNEGANVPGTDNKRWSRYLLMCYL